LTYQWNALADQAIGENALVRVQVLNGAQGSQMQSATGVGVSAPFQVRATSCIWPADASIYINDRLAQANQTYPIPAGEYDLPLTFAGTLAEGSGVMRFGWTYREVSTGKILAKVGQKVTQVFRNGTYLATLTAVGEQCPEARPALKSVTFRVGTGVADKLAYLPLIVKQQTAATASEAVETQTQGVAPSAPLDLQGSIEGSNVILGWDVDEASRVTHSLVYEGPIEGVESARVVLQLDAGRTAAVVPAHCGTALWVTLVNEAGESDPSDASFLTPPCDLEGAE
jgi:hypothetical protein